jgi:aryl-alcohol dehydrogenase-like predicted oxidoreductase
VVKLKEIAGRQNTSIPQAAIAWLLAKPYVSTVIIGANKVYQLEDNLGAADVILAEEEVTELDELTTPYVPYPPLMLPMGVDQMVKEALGQ